MEFPREVVEFPLQCKAGWKAGEDVSVGHLPRVVDNIIICGIGTSGVVADLLAAGLHDISVPVFVQKEYRLPGFVGSKTLLVALTYSGNTEEVLSLVQDGYRAGAQIVAVSSGGKIAALGKEKNFLVVDLPQGFPSKSALPLLFFAALSFLNKMGVRRINKREIEDLTDVLSNAAWRTKAEVIAQNIQGKIPLLYSSGMYKAAAASWRNAILNTAKLHTFVSVFPDVSHEDIFGFSGDSGGFFCVFLRDEFEQTEGRKLMASTKLLLEEQKVQLMELVLKGPSYVTKLSTAVYLGTLIGYALAARMGVGADDSPLANRLKAHLKKAL